MLIHDLTPHPTPGLAVSDRRMPVFTRAVLSHASRTYLLCRAVVCRVSTNNVRFELLVPGMPCGHIPSAMVCGRIII